MASADNDQPNDGFSLVERISTISVCSSTSITMLRARAVQLFALSLGHPPLPKRPRPRRFADHISCSTCVSFEARKRLVSVVCCSLRFTGFDRLSQFQCQQVPGVS